MNYITKNFYKLVLLNKQNNLYCINNYIICFPKFNLLNHITQYSRVDLSKANFLSKLWIPNTCDSIL